LGEDDDSVCSSTSFDNTSLDSTLEDSSETDDIPQVSAPFIAGAVPLRDDVPELHRAQVLVLPSPGRGELPELGRRRCTNCATGKKKKQCTEQPFLGLLW
jgi:hypothetical protein